MSRWRDFRVGLTQVRFRFGPTPWMSVIRHDAAYGPVSKRSFRLGSWRLVRWGCDGGYRCWDFWHTPFRQA